MSIPPSSPQHEFERSTRMPLDAVVRLHFEGTVAYQNGFAANVTVCLRGYRKLDGVYDLNLSVVSKNRSTRGFVSRLNVTGVAAGPALAFARTYLGAMRWAP